MNILNYNNLKNVCFNFKKSFLLNSKLENNEEKSFKTKIFEKTYLKKNFKKINNSELNLVSDKIFFKQNQLQTIKLKKNINLNIYNIYNNYKKYKKYKYLSLKKNKNFKFRIKYFKSNNIKIKHINSFENYTFLKRFISKFNFNEKFKSYFFRKIMHKLFLKKGKKEKAEYLFINNILKFNQIILKSRYFIYFIFFKFIILKFNFFLTKIKFLSLFLFLNLIKFKPIFYKKNNTIFFFKRNFFFNFTKNNLQRFYFLNIFFYNYIDFIFIFKYFLFYLQYKKGFLFLNFNFIKYLNNYKNVFKNN